jgi:tetratricopeptide (TPR) repeat protein
MSGREAMPQAKAASQRAMELDRNLAEAHSSYAASIIFLDLNWTEGESEFKHALELNPNVANIHYGYAINFLLPQKRVDEAIAQAKRALELEPMSIPIGANLAGLYIYAGKKDLALEQAKKITALEQNHLTAKIWLARAYVANEMFAEAERLMKDLMVSESNQSLHWVLGYVYAKTGRVREAEGVIAKLNELSKKQHVDRYIIASLYAALGDKDKAFPELEKSLEDRDWGIQRIRMDPYINPLRDDPRYKDIIRRMGMTGS